jgi:iron complex outermembrane receptor protein
MKLLLSIIGLLLAGMLAAQPASIRGQVTDPSGKSIPDAILSLSNGRGVSRSVKSDVQGQYQVRNIDPGIYTVRASAKGFAPAERTEYQVGAGANQVSAVDR